MAQKVTTKAKSEVAQGTDGGQSETLWPGPLYRPNTDIYEAGERIVVATDMPGVTADDIDVTLERRVLTIHGRVKPPVHEGYRQVYAEYGVGNFERVFTLSEDIDQGSIKASHRNGVLTLELPKAASAKPKKIKVKAS